MTRPLRTCLVACGLVLAGCTFDFDVARYRYEDDDVRPGDVTVDASGEPCVTNDDCLGQTPSSACRVRVCGEGGTCVETNAASGAPCTDGDPCTVDDRCAAGVCGGEPKDCADAHACTDDTCDAESGACRHDPRDAACPSTDPCRPAACDLQLGCVARPEEDGTPCDDGDACTTDDTCTLQRCGGIPRVCGNGEACVSWRCDSASGACVSTVDEDGATCDDGDACTEGDRCTGGRCAGPDNVCACGSTADCARFEDDDVCNGRLTCLDERCEVDPASVITCGDGPEGGCLAYACDPATGNCLPVPRTEGAPCDDGDPCTTDDACAADALCRGRSACDDGDACTVDTCDAVAGCGHTPAADATPCDDGVACTWGDACASGACVAGAPIPSCEDCTTADDGSPCEDGDPCTIRDVCRGGTCTAVTRDPTCDPCRTSADGTPCADSDRCTAGDACRDGVCVAGPRVPGCGPCTGWPDGTECDDGDACTLEDTCQSGLCVPGPHDPTCADCLDAPALQPCDDGSAATVGDLCTGGACLGFREQRFRDGGRSTRLTGVTFARGPLELSLGTFHAIGYAEREDGTPEAFVVEVPLTGAPTVDEGTRREDDRLYRRANGPAVVGDGGLVLLRRLGGWEEDSALLEQLAAFPPAAELTGVWVTRPTGTVAALSTLYTFAGVRARASDAESYAWVASCWYDEVSVPLTSPWTCAFEGDSGGLANALRLEGIAVFVAGADDCGLLPETPCLDPQASRALALGLASPDPNGQDRHTVYTQQPGGTDWRSSGVLLRQPGAGWRDLHGSARDNLWGAGAGGMLLHMGATVPSTVGADLEAPTRWSLDGIWSSDELVVVAATYRGPGEGPLAGATVNRLVVLTHRLDDGAPFERHILRTDVLCPAGTACPDNVFDGAAELLDVWVQDRPASELAGPRGIVAVGHSGTGDAGRDEALVYTLELP